MKLIVHYKNLEVSVNSFNNYLFFNFYLFNLHIALNDPYYLILEHPKSFTGPSSSCTNCSFTRLSKCGVSKIFV